MTAETETAAPEQDAPSGLEALAELQPQEEAVPVEPKIDDLGRAYATGRRKTPSPGCGSSPAMAASPSMVATKSNFSPVRCCA